MVSRPENKIIIKKPSADEPAMELPSQARRPDVGSYRLQVDRQTKGSYMTLEAAEKVGVSIKQEHPLVQVAIYDATNGNVKIIEAAKS
jgi:hypothetical protein